MKTLIQFMALLLPAALKCHLFRLIPGWSIGPGVKIGFSIFLGCDQVRIGSGVRIGHGNMFRKLRNLEIGDHTLIWNWNDFMAGEELGIAASLKIGSHSQVMSHHFLDCSGGITIGQSTLIGGRESQLWTHYYDGNKIQPRPLWIGDRCYICSRTTLVYCRIPAECVIGAGAVVVGDFATDGPGLLLAGNPATVKRKAAIK